MRRLVDKLTAELTEEYEEHLQTLLIDLRLGEEAELWVGFSLRSDQILRQLTLRVDADAGQEEASIRELFQQVEASIKTALAAEQHPTS